MNLRNSFAKGFEKIAVILNRVHALGAASVTDEKLKNQRKEELKKHWKKHGRWGGMFVPVDHAEHKKTASTSWFHRAHKTMSTKNLANHSSTSLKAMKAAKGLK